MTTRTDAHSPTNLITEDYEYVFAADMQGPWALDMDRQFLALLNHKDPADPHPEHSQCSHCGSHLRYVAWLLHKPTGYVITVGETCLENRFERATADFQRLRRQAKLDREKQRIRTAVNEFVEENPDLAWMGISNPEARWSATPMASRDNTFIADVARKLNQYGSLSDRQIDAVRTALQRDVARIAERAARAAEPQVECPEGRYVITGEIVKLKGQETDWGFTLKMIVKDDRGFRVWMTVPSSLQPVELGDRVTVTATVVASDRDESFGFGKRPSKASILQPA